MWELPGRSALEGFQEVKGFASCAYQLAYRLPDLESLTI